LTDVYQLEYFPAVCGFREDYEYEPVRWLNFFLYHGTERRIRIPSREGKPVMIEIEEPEYRPARVKFSDLLTLYDVKYTENSPLEDVESDFWDAFFQRPDCEDFDPLQYGHSPWWERCYNERRTVKELRERGDWDRLFLKMRTRKTINVLGSYPLKKVGTRKAAEEQEEVREHEIVAAPNQVQVVQYDFDTLGVRLLERPVHPEHKHPGLTFPKEWIEDLKVMILLKV
jgi:hypothetical protein